MSASIREALIANVECRDVSINRRRRNRVKFSIERIIIYALAVLGWEARAATNTLELTYFSMSSVREECVSRGDYRRLTLSTRLDGDVDVRYHEWSDVYGAAPPVVRTQRTNIEGAIDVQPVESFAGVLAAIASEHPQEEMTDSGYCAQLSIVTGGQRVWRVFYEPKATAQDRLRSELEGFVRTLETKHGLELSSTQEVSEGDTVHPSEVRLLQLIQVPAEYHGRRVRLTAYVVGRDPYYLAPNESVSSDFDRLVELGAASTLLYEGPQFSELEARQWITIEGVFSLRSPANRSAAGIVDRITRLSREP